MMTKSKVGKTKSQNDKKYTKGQDQRKEKVREKVKKTKRQKDRKTKIKLWCQGSFAILQCFQKRCCFLILPCLAFPCLERQNMSGREMVEEIFWALVKSCFTATCSSQRLILKFLILEEIFYHILILKSCFSATCSSQRRHQEVFLFLKVEIFP